MSEKLTIKCAGCDKTQPLRPRKVERYGGYSCRACGFTAPTPPDGSVIYTVVHAAGGFRGDRMQVADPETQAALQRARALRDAALKRLGELN
ncbi:hypothetical protein [Deinococcus knuensis]|uniref:Uncharacterized protein n=1 Tax=Deinococcus knuensis TaxID=1837380 RepID=A0ABQ2SHI4_9DEIO|nr:hypothetical protein [Deinococcus knuensis]GGS29083.1 hypothetical protein GCM10008961_21060 [Deinococcus knuensis]